MIFYVSGINRDLWDFWCILCFMGYLGIFGIFRDFDPFMAEKCTFTFREQLWSCQQKSASVKDRYLFQQKWILRMLLAVLRQLT